MESNYPRPDQGELASPYGKRHLTLWEHLVISGFWFATNFQWGAVLVILIPGDMRALAGDHLAQWMGAVIGIGALPALIVPLIAGPLSDRCTRKEGRRKPFIAVGALINMIGLAMMAFSAMGLKSVVAYLCSYAIVQIGNNIASGAYMGVIPDVVPKTEHGKASGFMALMSQLGTLVGMIGVGLLIPSSAEYLRYGLIASMIGFFAFLSYRGIRETTLTHVEPFHLKEYFASLWISPKQFPNFAWVWITRFLVMMGFYAILGYVNLYMVDVVNVSRDSVDGTVAKLFALILIVSSLTGYFGGTVSDKVGKKKVVYVANAIIAVITPFFIFCHDVPRVLVVAAIFGFGYGAYISVDYALGTDVLPHKEAAGKDMAVWHVAMTLPQSIAAPIAGVLLAAPGFERIPNPIAGKPEFIHYFNQGYASIFIACAICFALGAYLLRNVKGIQ